VIFGCDEAVGSAAFSGDVSGYFFLGWILDGGSGGEGGVKSSDENRGK
jgi:hypothetical protein